jgi:hypothetical protein
LENDIQALEEIKVEGGTKHWSDDWKSYLQWEKVAISEKIQLTQSYVFGKTDKNLTGSTFLIYFHTLRKGIT